MLVDVNIKYIKCLSSLFHHVFSKRRLVLISFFYHTNHLYESLYIYILAKAVRVVVDIAHIKICYLVGLSINYIHFVLYLYVLFINHFVVV